MTFLFIGQTELILIVLVVLLLFGGKKIPELMRGLGKGVKSFKDGMNGKDDVPTAGQDGGKNDQQSTQTNERESTGGDSRKE